ncbi:hypothetical protein H8D30_03420 [bacterium]|nr:hypothetical protein [bacterium]
MKRTFLFLVVLLAGCSGGNNTRLQEGAPPGQVGSGCAACPLVPTDLAGTQGDHDNQVVLTWSLGTGQESHQVWRGTGGVTEPVKVADLLVDALTWTDTTMTRGTTYRYHVVLKDSASGFVGGMGQGVKGWANPITTIDSGPPDPSTTDTATFVFSGDLPTFECELDGDGTAWALCESPKVYTGLADGTHNFQVRTREGEIFDLTPDTWSWRVNDLPETTIDSGPPNPDTSDTATFTFSSDDPAATFECELDGDGTGWAPCTSPHVITGLTEMTHHFEVRAVVGTRIDDTPATWDWLVDLSAPETQIDSGPAQDSFTSSTEATFTFSSPDTPTATFLCDLDGLGFSSCTSPITYIELAEEAHHFEVKAFDGVSEDPTPATRDWTVDITPPDTTIDSGPADPTSSQNATFAFSSNETGGSFECDLDTGGWAACTSPHTYTGLTEGPHHFEVRSSDLAGNVDATPAPWDWTIDLPPETTIDSGPADPDANTSATFSFSSSDPGSTFDCALEGGAWASCTSPHTYTGLTEGAHHFEVRAHDGLSNDPTPAVWDWTIDTTPPDTTIDSGPNDPTTATDATFTFSSNDPAATFSCDLDTGGWASCTSPQTYTRLSVGTHHFEVRATDLAGNIDPTPAVWDWTIEPGIEPETTIDSGPAEGSVTPSTEATFTFSSDDPLATFECDLNSGGFAVCTTPKTYTGLTDGEQVFQVRAVAAGGLKDSTPATRKWTVDTIPPETTIDSGPADPTTATDATFTFSSDDPAATFECDLDISGWVACTSPKTYTGLSVGAHHFEVMATDLAGNIDSTPAVWDWTIDPAAEPETTIESGPAEGSSTQLTEATFTFSSDDPDATFECDLDGGGWLVCVTPKTYTGLADGGHTFQVRAVALDGSKDSTPATRNWTVDTLPPETTIDSGPADPTFLTDATFTFSSSEAGSSFGCQLDGGGWFTCFSPKTYTGLAPGAHTFEVEATDSAGNQDPTPAVWNWTIQARVHEPPPILDDFETGDFSKYSWVSENPGWVVQTGTVYEGLYSAGSEVITHNETAALELDVEITIGYVGTVQFAHRVSSEATYDFLRFYVDGVQQDEWDGEVAWATSSYEISEGQHTLRWTYEKDGSVSSGQDAAYIDLVEITELIPEPPPQPPILDDFETGDFSKYPWKVGAPGWNVGTDQIHGGLFSAGSDVITHGEAATLELTVEMTAPGTVKFWYSVSSETNWDFLRFYIDGVEQSSWSGIVAWAQASFALTTGQHTLKWVYDKDGSVNSNSDKAWIDDVEVTQP